MGELAGDQPGLQGAGASGLAAQVAQKLAMADQIMQEAGAIMPALAPIMAALRDQMRSQSATVIFGSSGQAAPPAQSASVPMGMLAGM
jgi:hypothetical protein